MAVAYIEGMQSHGESGGAIAVNNAILFGGRTIPLGSGMLIE